MIPKLQALIDAWRDTPHRGTWSDALEAAADEVEELIEEHDFWMPLTDRPELGDCDANGCVIVLHMDQSVSVQPVREFPWSKLIGPAPTGWSPVVLP